MDHVSTVFASGQVSVGVNVMGTQTLAGTAAVYPQATNLQTDSVRCTLPVGLFEKSAMDDQSGWLSPGSSPSEAKLRQLYQLQPERREFDIESEDTDVPSPSDREGWLSPDSSPRHSPRPINVHDFPQVTVSLIPTVCPPPQVVSPFFACIPIQMVATTQVVEDAQRTTMMMRNLPNDYSKDMILQLLDDKGFKGRYDFFYLPIDFKTDCSMGYAFVNFLTHADAVHAKAVLDGHGSWVVASQKVLELSWSDYDQGLEANIERHRNSAVFHPTVPEKFQPVVFSQGVQIPFPQATKSIRQPRFKIFHDELEKVTCGKSFVDLPLSLSRPERIKRTIFMINGASENLKCLLSHARKTLASTVNFQALRVTDELENVGQVCSFHTKLQHAIPDLNLSMDKVDIREGLDGSVIWRVACTGTQGKVFVPGIPIGEKANFSLEVTMRVSEETSLPVFLQYDFQAAQVEPEPDLDPKILKHRMGDCQPCAYFAFRADGCRAGDDCEFCHLCTKQQAKAKKKVRAKDVTRITSQEDM